MLQKLEGQIFMGVVRHGLTTLGGIFLASGYGNNSQWQSIAGGLLTAAGVAWSAYQKHSASKS